RCSRMWQIDGAIQALKAKFPQSKISVLAQPSVGERLKQNRNVSEVFLYGDAHFNNRHFPAPLLDRLRSRRFPLGVIPFNNMTGNGYGEVRAIALNMNIPKLVGVNIQNKVFDLSDGKIGC
ncbi:MAG: radical SAM protein, partial [Nitrospinales bacterium]